MLIKKLSFGVFCLSIFTATFAQTAANQHDHAPAKAAAAAPAPVAVTAPAPMKMANQPSAFKNYRAFKADEPMQDWRAANDAMELLGGHMGHVRNKPVPTDAAQPAAPKAKP